MVTKGVFIFLWIPFIKLCMNIHRSVWQLLGVGKKSKWRPLPWQPRCKKC
jgi:hypothetical protein